MKCPHCNKSVAREPFLQNAMLNCEHYGSNAFTFKCKHCNKKYTVFMTRKVVVSKETYKAKDDADLSFGTAFSAPHH